MSNIAVLGWGSLIWDKKEEFNRYLMDWKNDGPQLPIEFCRISSTRHKALTLVIDQKLGTMVEVLYAFSRRTIIDRVIDDLRVREGTNNANIGYVNLANSNEHSRDQEILEVIKNWARSKNIPCVVWTDLTSSFPKNNLNEFLKKSVNHLRSLNDTGIQEAVKYIVNTPRQIDTRLRRLLMEDEWFTSQVAIYNKVS